MQKSTEVCCFSKGAVCLLRAVILFQTDFPALFQGKTLEDDLPEKTVSLSPREPPWLFCQIETLFFDS